MSKVIKMGAAILAIIAILLLSISSATLASTNYYDNVGNAENPGVGPAPNFGDGISDGPGW